jgi:hypothetical protein
MARRSRSADNRGNTTDHGRGSASAPLIGAIFAIPGGLTGIILGLVNIGRLRRHTATNKWMTISVESLILRPCRSLPTCVSAG